MYKHIDQRTGSCVRSSVAWKEYLKLNTDCIKYLEIGNLHGGSLLYFHNTFGPNVYSTSIDPFSICDYYNEYSNEHETNYEIFQTNKE